MKLNWDLLSFFNGPLLIDPAICQSLMSALNEKNMNGEITAKSPAQSFDKRGGTAIIGIDGVITHRPGLMSWLFGGTSIEGIRESFRISLADPGISRIVFDISSPGGDVSGVFDLADDIYEARGIKPIYAIANEIAFSAAYAIASAADKIFVPRSGSAGSIGVLAVHVDKSKSEAAEGLVYNMIYAGSKKVELSEHLPLTDAARSSIQTDVDSIYALFVDTIARNRGIKASAIRDQEAGRFRGKLAVEAGLADGVLSYNQALNKITGNTTKGGIKMQALIGKIRTVLSERTDLVEASVFEQMGYVPKLAAGMVVIQAAELEAVRKSKTDAEDAAAAALKTAEDTKNYFTALHDVCALSGTLNLLGGFIKNGVSVEDAKKTILDANAKRGVNIISTVSSTTTGEVNPLQEDARRRAGIK